MSIATAINDLSGRIQDAYTALSAKGATMPAAKNTANLSACIDSIPSGGGGNAVAIGGFSLIEPAELLLDGIPANNNSITANVSLLELIAYDGYIDSDTIIFSDGTSVNTGETNHYSVALNGKSAYIPWFSSACLLAGTKISLADGTTKNIEDITHDDELLVWDFDNGCFSKAKSLWIKKAQTTDFMYEIKFASGNSIDATGPKGHRAFNIDESKFVYMNDSVGQKVKTIDGTDEVVCCEKKTGKFDFYNIITDGHLNLFANGILTSCRLNNYRKIVGMKFAEPSRAFHTKEDFKGLPDRYVDGLHLIEQDIDKDELLKYVNRLLDNKL